MSIPIIVLPKDQSILGHEKKSGMLDSLYYVVSADGLYLRKRNELYDCVHKAEFPKNLGGAKEDLRLKCKSVPRKLLMEVVAFLAEVCRKHDAEGVAILYYHPKKQEWIYVIPEQETQEKGLSVDYDMPQTPDGYIPFGSIHSHAGSSAFQSGTDHEDEEKFEGIHITVGHLPGNPDYHVRFHACGESWDFADETHLMEPEKVALVPVPKGAMEKVKLKSKAYHFNARTPHGLTRQGNLWPQGGEQLKRDKYGPRGDGTIWCQQAKKSVPPFESKEDHNSIGRILEHEKQKYIKTTAGWIEWDEAEDGKKTGPSKGTPTSSEGGRTGGTEADKIDRLFIEERAESDTEEILWMRDDFFGDGALGDCCQYKNQSYKKTPWGWENAYEIEHGQGIIPVEAHKEMYGQLDEEDKQTLARDYDGKLLAEMLKGGWSPQDCLMALEVHEGVKREA